MRRVEKETKVPRHIGAAAAGVMLAAIAAGAAGEAAPPAPPPEHLAPLILETDDGGGTQPPAAEKPQAKPAETVPPIRVDEEKHSVRIPVRFSRAEGTVEWLLSAGQTHVRMSVLVTERTAAEAARALERAGLAAGTAPAPVGADRVLPPAGTTVELELVVTRPGGTLLRYPANLFLATSPGGDPVANGRWVCVGPAIVREGDATLLVTTLSGSLVTTNLRDSSALVYWVPSEAEDYVRSFYVSGVPLPAEGFACELEIRAAEAKPTGANAEAPAPETPPAPEPNAETGVGPTSGNPTEGP